VAHELVWRIERVGVVESTNEVVFKRALEGEREGLVLVADAQTRGKGRLGREWFSPHGKSLYMSILFRPSEDKRQFITFTCALAVSDALKRFGLEAGLKWPNDVIVRMRKICGILCESGHGFVVAGLGVNLNVDERELPEEIRGIATSFLIETGQQVDRDEFLKEVLNSLKLWYIKPHPEVLAETRIRSATLGQIVRAVLPSGDIVEGLAEKIDESGALIIRTLSGVKRVLAGEIVHLR